VGIAVVSATTPPDPRCTQGRYQDLLRRDPIRPTRFSAWVPCIVAAVVSVGAFLFPDPMLVLPVAWGIWYMQRSLQNWIALEVLLVTCVATAVQVGTERWVIREVL